MINRLELLSRTSNLDKTIHFISNDVGAIQSEQQYGLVINTVRETLFGPIDKSDHKYIKS